MLRRLLFVLLHLACIAAQADVYCRQANLQTYGLLRSIQDNMIRTPKFDLSDCICFEDALGRIKQLPYEYFRHWEVRAIYSLFASPGYLTSPQLLEFWKSF